MSGVVQDLRYGVRWLGRNPGFTAAAVLTLALGIGVNSSIFSVVDAVALRPLPFQNPDQIARIYGSRIPEPYRFSYPEFRDLGHRNQVFTGLAGYTLFPLNFSHEDRSEIIWGQGVSGNYFSVLGVQPMLGRAFLPEEDRISGAPLVAVLAHSLWQRCFGADPGVVGKSILLNGRSLTVIGVTPRGFRGAEHLFAMDAYLPLPALASLTPRGGGILNDPDYSEIRTIGRLKPGVSVEHAQANMEVLGRQLAEAYPKKRKWDEGLRVMPETRTQAHWRPLGILLMAAATLVVLIVCANVSNLLLAQAESRRAEVAVRLALGARRGRLIRQLLTESMLLSLGGATAAALLAYWTVDLIAAFRFPTALPIGFEIRLDHRVLGFTLLVSVLCGVVFGLAPALQAGRLDLITSLKGESARAARGLRRVGFRNVLATAQMALSLVLLTGAGLLVRSIWKIQAVDPGFQVGDMLLVSFSPGLSGYSAAQAGVFYRQLVERVRTLPGVTSVSLAQDVPLGADSHALDIVIPGYELRPDQESTRFRFNAIGVDYFRAMGIPLLAGRDFDPSDDSGSRRVAIINETMARRFWPGYRQDQNPIGKHFRTGGPIGVDREIIGVVRDSKYRTVREPPQPYFYLPLAQRSPDFVTLLVRTAGDPHRAAGPVRREIHALDKNLPVLEVRTLDEAIDFSIALDRLVSRLAAVMGLLATLLAAIGLYGVLSYAVSRRTHEIGVRIALGAGQKDVWRLVAKQGLALTATGMALGFPLVYLAAGSLQGALYGVGPADPLTFAATALLLASVALLACYVPARRAATVNPVEALRHQ